MRETVFLNIRKRNDSYMSAKPLVLRGVERYFQQSGCFLINIINLNSWVFSENHKTIYIIRIYFCLQMERIVLHWKTIPYVLINLLAVSC